MLHPRRLALGLVAFGSVTLASCSDSEVVAPADDSATTVLPGALAGAYTSDGEGAFILPPLAETNPKPEGEFNPDLAPGLALCKIGDVGDLLAVQDVDGPRCHPGSAIALDAYGPGDATVSASNEQYQFSFDTDNTAPASFVRSTGPRADRYDDFYELQVVVAGQVVAAVTLDPQAPDGPGQSEVPDLAYAFRVGETIPVKLWLGRQLLCPNEPADEVIECSLFAIFGNDGADVALTGGSDPRSEILGLQVPPNALPPGYQAMSVLLERIYWPEASTDGECIPLPFDAPVYDGTDPTNTPGDDTRLGECFRITPFPDIQLVKPATISICVDPVNFFPGDEGRQSALEMVKFSPSQGTDGKYFALTGSPENETSCSDAQLAALMAASDMMMNLEFGDGELRPITLGGLSSSFSDFTFALTGVFGPDALTFEDGTDASLIRAEGQTVILTARVLVQDYLGDPIEGATIHFDTNDGSVSAADDLSDAQGIATVDWTVDTNTVGVKRLRASALGLSTSAVPTEDYCEYDPETGELVSCEREIVEDSFDFTVTVCSDGFGSAFVDGAVNGQDAWDCATESPEPFVVNLGGGEADGTLKWMNDADSIYFLIQVPQTADEDINSLRIDIDSDRSNSATGPDDVIGLDVDKMVAYDGYLSDKCANRSQSSCYAVDDDGMDVRAAVQNDGVWTTYEISHPLNLFGANGDDVDANGDDADPLDDAFGFFVTLSNGNGAKGNTQFVAFRDYTLKFLLSGF